MEMTEESLLQKHRKERKDLQAKIQSLKKTSDKKKKKETAQLILQLETELKDQQQTELDQLIIGLKHVQVEDEQTIIENNSDPPTVERISKAQRRRSKKLNNELENQRLIAEQEVLNQLGPRHIESQAFKEILKTKQLSLFVIPSDGDCLYHAIDHQLKTSGRDAPGVQKLRSLTASYMRAHKNDMLPFMITENGDIMTDNGFEDYCQRIETTQAWGSQIELTALADILKCPIHVLQASGPPTILGSEFPPPELIITYHRHMYGLGEHYNSTIKKIHQVEDE